MTRCTRVLARRMAAAGWLMAALLAGPAIGAAQTCSEEEIGHVIDGTGQMLREINDEYAPQLSSKLEIVAATRDLSDDEVADYARKLMRAPKVKAAESRASELLGRIEAIGDEATGDAADCVKLKAIQASSAELREALAGKYQVLFARIDADLAGKSEETADLAAAAPAPEPQTAKAASEPEAPASTPAPQVEEPALAPLPEQEVATLPSTDWSAEQDAASGQDGIVAFEPSIPQTGPRLSALDEELTTYSSDEILSAGKGFFGSVTTGLAGVVAYAFEQAGRPSGYIFGNEGSVAFIAGLRYGKGRLHTKRGGRRTVYWQGPSIGTDAGAEGARTMILVYNLKEPIDIFAHFGGVDGSAYVVGGVGITFLTDGDLVLAPIRSGLGLRLGANIGYLKFTPERSIIPF